MSQEITVMVMVDVQAALIANSLEGNIYLIDNLRTEGSTGLGTDDLTTAVHSSHWSNGSQAYEPLFNWLPYSISSLPPTLPRNYMAKIAKNSDQTALEMSLKMALTLGKPQKTRLSAQSLNKKFNQVQKSVDLINQHSGVRVMVRDVRGNKQDTGIKLMSKKGELIHPHAPSSAEYLSHLTPQITDITGEAVDLGILYPAQYGTPIEIKDGWYWSATVSSFKPGLYSYTMHITLYKMEPFVPGNTEIVWEPVYFTHDAKIKVDSKPMRNGFTKAGLWYLPIH